MPQQVRYKNLTIGGKIMSVPKPVVLCILDGFGYNPQAAGNAIAVIPAKRPNSGSFTSMV